jgi:hypothetical protein
MLIPAQKSNKANYKIQDCFANRQIKENVKCNTGPDALGTIEKGFGIAKYENWN